MTQLVHVGNALKNPELHDMVGLSGERQVNLKNYLEMLARFTHGEPQMAKVPGAIPVERLKAMGFVGLYATIPSIPADSDPKKVYYLCGAVMATLLDIPTERYKEIEDGVELFRWVVIAEDATKIIERDFPIHTPLSGPQKKFVEELVMELTTSNYWNIRYSGEGGKQLWEEYLVRILQRYLPPKPEGT